MSRTKYLDETVKQYIIDHIDASGYLDDEPETDAEKVKFLAETFQAEYSWAIPRYGLVKALSEWFQGLPSACTVDFYNDAILELAEQWGSLPKHRTERREDAILGNWWNLIANKTAQLFRKYDVTPHA